VIRPGIRRLFRLALYRRELSQRDLDEEIRLHLELRARELERAGLSPEQASAEAQRRFGEMGEARRRLGAAVRRRDRHGTLRELLDDISQDLRYGLRSLGKARGFTVVAVLTLALGIGATTAIFSVVDGVLFRALPFADPDRLVLIWETSPAGEERNIVSSGNYLDWREQSSAFEELGTHGGSFGITLTGVEEPVRVMGTSASPSVFRVLGAQAMLGRTFSREEEAPGSGNVVLVSHGFWQRHLGGRPDPTGRTVVLNGVSYEVIGVMSPGFRFPSPEVEFWLPRRFDADDRNSRRAHQWRVLARLRSGTSVDRAQAEMSGIAARLASAYPEWMNGWGVRVVPYRADLVRDVRPLLLVLLGAVGLVLLVACANVANLLLARAVTREREVALRTALGARRGRLLRQFLTESALLALLSAAAALMVLVFTMDALLAHAPPDIPLLQETRIDGRVLLFAGAITLGGLLLCGLLPAVRASRSDVQSTLRDTGSPFATRGHRRLRNGLLVFEVAVSVLLLIGAALLTRSFATLLRVDYGFNPDRLLLVGLDLPYARYQGSPAHLAFGERLLARARSLPGVTAADLTTEPPIVGYNNTFSFVIEGRPRSGPDPREDPVPLRPVTPGYFRTMGVPIMQGRAFEERDRPGMPAVVIVNAVLAEKFWPGQNPVGVRLSREGPSGPWLEIVGVAGDTRHFGLEADPEPALYIPYAQKPWAWMSWMSLMVRTSGDPMQLASGLRREIQSLDPDLALERVATIHDIYGESLARRRFTTLLIGGFAFITMTLGVVGIYGVLSYVMAQQRRDVGVRMALGARVGQVVRLIMAQGMALALAGVVLGILAALALTRLLSGLLYQTSPRDLATFVGVSLLLLGVAAVACWLPARRAARVDPVQALRAD